MSMQNVFLAFNRRLKSPRVYLPLVIIAGVAIALFGLEWRNAQYNAFLQKASLQQLQYAAKLHSKNPRVFYCLARRWEQFGNIQAARDAYAQSVTLDPDLIAGWLGWARADEVLQGPRAGELILQTLLKLKPSSASAHLALAQLYQQMQNHAAALKEAQKTVRYAPQNADAWRLMGVEQLALGLLPQAERSLKRAQTLSPSNADTLVALGRLYLQTRRMQEATTCLQKAALLNPQSAQTHYWLGLTFLQAAQLASTPFSNSGRKTTAPASLTPPQKALLHSAETEFSRAMALQPTNGYSCLLQAQTLLLEGHRREAIRQLERAEQLLPLSPVPPMQLASLYAKEGAEKKALAQRVKLQKLNKYYASRQSLLQQYAQTHKPYVELQLARLDAANNALPQALAFYQDYLRQAPNDAKAQKEFLDLQDRLLLKEGSEITLLQRGDKLYREGNYTRALPFYLAALKLNRNSAQAAQGVGLCLNQLDRPDDAFYFLVHATKLEPYLADAQFALAQMYTEAGFTTEAAQRLRLALKARPNDTRIMQALGSVLSQAVVTQAEGLDWLSRAAALRPNNLSLLLDLAESQINNDKLADADETYQRALRLAPQDPEVLLRYAGFLVENRSTPQNFQKAKQLLSQVAPTASTKAYWLYCWGRIALQEGKTQKAIAQLRRAVQLEPDAAQGWYCLSRAYALTGQSALAEQALARSQTLQHTFQALSSLQEMVKNHPRDFNLHLRLARLNAKRGRNAQAINQYQICLLIQPNNRAVDSELQKFVHHLKKMGQMPSMSVFNAMVASLTTR